MSNSRGPIPISDAVKKRRGTYRPSRAKGTQHWLEPEPLTKVPRVPVDLMPEAKEFWKITAKGLVERRILTSLDLFMFRMLCEMYGWYNRYLRMLAETPIDKPTIAKSYAGEARAWHKMFIALARDFYLTPPTRKRLALSEPEDETPNPWDQI